MLVRNHVVLVRLRCRAAELANLGISTLQDVDQAVETLSGGQRQAVAVARAAAFGSKVLILDEPTAALGVRQTKEVLDLIRRLRAEGHAVVVISHNLENVFAVADRICVLRLGRDAGSFDTASTSRGDIVAAITGAEQAAAPTREPAGVAT